MKIKATHTPLGRTGHYPALQTVWTEDEDSNGWTGEAILWGDGNTKQEGAHSISLRQSMPLGIVTVMVDEVPHGCWSATSFDGVGLTERDLQWAAAYAAESIKRKRE